MARRMIIRRQRRSPRLTGLRREEINQLEKKIFRVLRSNKESKCPICLEEFKSGDEIFRLPICKHDFHRNCIRPWLKKRRTCPICRSDVLQSKIKEINNNNNNNNNNDEDDENNYEYVIIPIY
ncbi:Oidioi.mRNA.OKI2018_I69.chr1.g937.t1.cds [Oikopleura dioica]|uniref:Oidioi.mRNA.OKI2018_I69.chr1.g937.t1.cds n=1 Tax=Oikopleura dioica TaxID=34765 RepID=A0ABN7SVM9_OIKDI|nr:Oidioi.mRNA.OKI2018_I69.chr1.g937.t1.cds [Oikopleura dioica]